MVDALLMDVLKAASAASAREVSFPMANVLVVSAETALDTSLASRSAKDADCAVAMLESLLRKKVELDADWLRATVFVLWAASVAEFEAMPTAIVAALVCSAAMFAAFIATVEPGGSPCNASTASDTDVTGPAASEAVAAAAAAI